ncbi:hypothetical protein GCM10010435_94030 [Winogradskya consettensis]|uniref:Uncharacterized protein n=1 Tax=Winogradskya consettensis TaxID=113560 RepID=A0A919T4C3_9ACTN|nr:hypothetical protein Aco04nite_91480 [Actinoplanes consettensis]
MNDRVSASGPAVVLMPLGTPGVVIGVTAAVAMDSPELPTLFVACTVKMYDVPFRSPVTVQGEAEQFAVTPSGVEVTV